MLIPPIDRLWNDEEGGVVYKSSKFTLYFYINKLTVAPEQLKSKQLASVQKSLTFNFFSSCVCLF